MNLLNKFKEFFTNSKIKELEEKIAQIQKNQIKDVLHPIKFEFKGIAEEKLIQKCIYNVGTRNIDVVFTDGDIISGVVEQYTYEQIRNATSKEDVLDLLIPKIKGNDYDIDKEEDDIKTQIAPIVSILSEVDDFEVVGEDVFLKGVKSIAIPSSIVAEFIRIVSEMDKNREKDYGLEYISKDADLGEEYNSLLMFTRWLLMNPIESARRDCLTFVKKNDIKLTTNGLMQCYRRVVSKNKSNEKLVKFVSESYFKVKKNKKSPKSYTIAERLGDYKLVKNGEIFKDDNPYWTNQGNLYDLYQNLANLQQKSYTDSHTKSKDIKIGAIYKEDEDNIDLDNTKDCSSGLHVGAKNFGFDGFGDVGVLALVNPMYVRSVPVSDAHKMRVSEMFIATTMEKEDYDNLNDIVDFSEEYCNATVEELTENLKNKSFSNLSCQDNLPVLNLKEVENITSILKNRIISI